MHKVIAVGKCIRGSVIFAKISHSFIESRKESNTMMSDYEFEFSKLLQSKLKTKIIGRIYVGVINTGELYININRDVENNFKLYISNFSERFYNGWSTDDAMYEILSKYREFITKRYFY